MTTKSKVSGAPRRGRSFERSKRFFAASVLGATSTLIAGGAVGAPKGATDAEVGTSAPAPGASVSASSPGATSETAAPSTAPAASPSATASAPSAGTPAPTPSTAPRAPDEQPSERSVVANTSAAPGCEPCDEQDAVEGAGVLIVGPAFFDLASLNDRLQASGYEKLPATMTVIGAEGRAVFRSGFVAGARGAGILAPSTNGPNGFEAAFGGGFGMLDFGYAFVHTAPILFALTGNIGGYGIGLDIGDKQSAAFDDVLKNPRRSASLGRGGVLVGATLSFDARVHFGPTERGRRGFFTVGARLGGLFGPPIGDWSLSQGGQVTGAPSTGLSGGYALFAIGFGGGRPTP